MPWQTVQCSDKIGWTSRWKFTGDGVASAADAHVGVQETMPNVNETTATQWNDSRVKMMLLAGAFIVYRNGVSRKDAMPQSSPRKLKRERGGTRTGSPRISAEKTKCES